MDLETPEIIGAPSLSTGVTLDSLNRLVDALIENKSLHDIARQYIKILMMIIMVEILLIIIASFLIERLYQSQKERRRTFEKGILILFHLVRVKYVRKEKSS